MIAGTYVNNYLGILCFLLTLVNKNRANFPDVAINEIERHRLLEKLLQDIVIRMGRLRCLCVITDSIYTTLLHAEFFDTLGQTPFFKVSVKDYEDLGTPHYKTLKAIRQVRKDGCNGYIILIANGFQLSRFLKFGDRYRLLDTRANFVLLYDRRLFRHQLNYLWKKMVNVVFVRGNKARIRRGKPVTTWFELLTVPFPSPIEDVLTARPLTIWKNGRFKKQKQLFVDKTSDLRGQALKVVTFEHIPSAVRLGTNSLGGRSRYLGDDDEGTNFGGLEIEVLDTLAEAMNFEKVIYEAGHDLKWGKKLVNGSYDGMLGEMIAGRAEVALANLYHIPYYIENLDLSIPYNTECLTFLTPQTVTDVSWKTLILPFETYMWVAIIVTLFFSGLIFYLLAHFHRKVEGEEPLGLNLFGELDNGILYTYGMLLLVSLPKIPTRWSIRFLTGSWWVYCLLVVVAYRASMTAILAKPAPKITIDTLEQLAMSRLTCGGWGENIKEFFETSLDKYGQIIGENFVVTYDTEEAFRRVANGEFAYYENVYFLKYSTVKLDHVLGRNLHIMGDCVINMPISIGLQKNSPLKPRVDKFLRRVVEAGLVEKWLNDVMLPVLTAEDPSKENVKALISLKKLYGGLVAIAIGYSASIVLLLGEIIHWHCVVKRNPIFDKYALYMYYSRRKKSKRFFLRHFYK